MESIGVVTYETGSVDEVADKLYERVLLEFGPLNKSNEEFSLI